MKLSIVASLYKSAQYINEFYERTSASAQALVDDDYEIVFVNDGSPDDSLELAVRLADTDGHVVVVDLSRNFGHHKAMMTGLSYARGEKVFLIDTDLEEDPEYLLKFAQKMDSEQCDVVYGVQEKRKGGWFERLSGSLFWKIINFLSGLSLQPNIATARYMTSRYVKSLLLHDEREVFMAGLWAITGYNQVPYLIKKHNRGESTYTLRKKFSLLVNSITSFSNLPLVGIFYVGIVILIIASLYISYLLFNWLFFSSLIAGWTSVIASIWLLGGLVISFMGIIGIYLSKIFSETKRRPYAIVRNVYGKRT
ncbi:MAG: glycosyl transferase [Betaproteobacteria bacterium HGW-Betaproteobacteria-1]|jgi:putative glycosyltransferase|nr:MAG: glycosyl transferase [Betaproteobacteria bacterium HGW-Betaproteobacteria-1]